MSTFLTKLNRLANHPTIIIHFRPFSGPLEHAPNAKLDKSLVDRYMCLPIPNCKCQVKYIWIDGTGENIRSKSRTLDTVPSSYKEVPNWTYDGSSTGQATGENSDLHLCPCAMYPDPINKGDNKIVLCETYLPNHKPAFTNHRASCVEAVNDSCKAEVLFGFEQEYHIMDADRRPYGWPIMMGEPAPSNKYYCGVGADKTYGREIVEAHYRACLYSEILFYGTNAEGALSQWEFQIGTGMGVKVADDLWVARFLLERIAEEYGVAISFDPKLLPNWNGAGLHTNFSTKVMRAEGGMKMIEDVCKLLESKHVQHLIKYDPKGGLDNARRLTGRYHAPCANKFSVAVGNRNACVRIPRSVAEENKGYIEDRRPASNADPYSVVDIIIRTCFLK